MAHSCWWQIQQWATWLGLGGVAHMSIKPAHLSIKLARSGNYILLAMSSAVGLYGLTETNKAVEQLEDFWLGHQLALANTMFKQHPRPLYTLIQIDYILIEQKWKTSMMNCRTYPGADCDSENQLLVATLKVRLAKNKDNTAFRL